MIEPWLKAIRDHPDDLPPAEFRVLVMLSLRLDWRTGAGFASVRQLMADADASDRTVRRATTWARQRGLLREVTRGHRLGDGRTRATEWALISTGHWSPVESESQPVSGSFSTGRESDTSLPVPPSDPVGLSRKGMGASRRARPAVTRDEDKIDMVERAIARRGWDDEIYEEDALNIWARFIDERKTAAPVADPVKYLAGIFESFDSLDGVLSNTPEREAG